MKLNNEKSPLEGIWVMTTNEISERVYIGNKLIKIIEGDLKSFEDLVYDEGKYVAAIDYYYDKEEKKWKMGNGSGLDAEMFFSFDNGILTVERKSYGRRVFKFKKVDDEARFNTIKNLLENGWEFETKAEREAKEDAERAEKQRTPFTGIWLLQNDGQDKLETVYVKDYCIQIKNGEYDNLGRFAFTEEKLKEQYAFYYHEEHKEWAGMVFGAAKSKKYKIENDILTIEKKKYQKVNDLERFNKIKSDLAEAEANLDDDWEGIE
jgi:hypothetical protein